MKSDYSYKPEKWKGVKFLNLWNDADPSIAEVEDAKERLAGLND